MQCLIRVYTVCHFSSSFYIHQSVIERNYGVPILRVTMVDGNVYTPASVAQLDAQSDWRPGGRGFNPHRGRQHSFVEIDREIFYGHSLPSADSRRAVVSFWRNNVHNTG